MLLMGVFGAKMCLGDFELNTRDWLLKHHLYYETTQQSVMFKGKSQANVVMKPRL